MSALRKTNVLYSISSAERLMGNLAHRFIEKLLVKDIQEVDQTTLHQWIDELEKEWLPKEGAVLLMYGQETQRTHFLRTLKFSVWALVNLIRNNNWSIESIESKLTGPFEELEMIGRSDLILVRDEEKAIIDLKWSGYTFRKNLIKNEEDLQLNLYAKLYNPSTWVHTGYFIINRGKMVCRNQEAFKEAEAVVPQVDPVEKNDMIHQKLIDTYRWRIDQLINGSIEVRTSQTTKFLDEHYGEQLMPLLEMKREDNRFEVYQVLLGMLNQ